jgi:hypothetical protein
MTTWRLCNTHDGLDELFWIFLYDVNAQRRIKQQIRRLKFSPLIGGAKRGVGEFAFWVWITLTDTTVTSFLVYNSIYRPIVGRFFESRFSLLFQVTLQQYFIP